MTNSPLASVHRTGPQGSAHGGAAERDDRPWEAGQFESLLKSLLTSEGGVSAVTTFAEAGYTVSRYGLRLSLPSGAAVYLQIVSASAPDGRAPQQGTAPPRLRAAALPARGKTSLSAVERHLQAVLSSAGDRRIRLTEPYSARGASIAYGLHVRFHNGATVYCYVVHALAPGTDVPRGRPFRSVRQI
ncbi:hypothetical protein OG689_41765 [Kitasatospora sp. NBC_00240]|uniref:hypothetical protein n=1 Tax=Kitasatospora sp. NBC_00240 TaxID=2903567 RepID=UPI0022551D80|nr:hypothetical protein [Kitasatospora sp. NBC_00240]MCX5215686.1 hypothetical protein [Kitasatospora sp. NBC_00240]